MELNVLNINGQETGRKVTLDASVFGVEPNDHVIYLDVKRYLANKRQGTHKTKERAEVAFSTRKLFRQKGTGGARRGSIKSPLLRGGGTVFGPRPRDYEQKVNKKVKQLARISAPVSYTHLDVYKRQVYVCTLLRLRSLIQLCVRWLVCVSPMVRR